VGEPDDQFEAWMILLGLWVVAVIVCWLVAWMIGDVTEDL
jgi:hypothetical protein